ncbi:MAG TPA: mannose-6-phosphate isomerase, class I, partial [Panacibacter sp.]|nr:mannose-6-phosphate isomerase, class I [Panacibacter sp.]
MIQGKIFKLKGKVMHYAWGGAHFIPQWMGVENSKHQPYAEYWMGVHPLAPSLLLTDEKAFSLRDNINENPIRFLGERVYKQFGELPYLFKVQDVKEMLSIQVHPSKTEAEKGFAAEEAAGIPANAPNRNYKDKNHKPEVLVALSEFWLLHGFLEKGLMKKTLQSVPEFETLFPVFETQG